MYTEKQMNKDEEIAWNLLAHYITAKNIITIVEKRTGINIREQTRKRAVSDARHIAMYLIKENTCLSYKQTARACGLQSHTTAWYACKQVKNHMSLNRDFKEKYGDLIDLHFEKTQKMKTIACVKARDLIFEKKIEKRADGMVYIVEVSRKEIRKLIKLEKMFEVKSLEYYLHDIYFIEHEGANYKVHFTIPIVKEPDESKMKDKTFELAERLADEAFGSKGVIEYSSRQELTVKFYEMLKETLIEL